MELCTRCTLPIHDWILALIQKVHGVVTTFSKLLYATFNLNYSPQCN